MACELCVPSRGSGRGEQVRQACALGEGEGDWAGPTCIQEVEGFVEDIRLVNLGVAAVHYEGVSNKQTGVANPRAGSLGRRGEGVANHAPAGLNHPQIAFDRRAIDQATHDVNIAFFRGH